MSAPEVRDAVERADIEARCRKWSKKHGPGSAVLRHKLAEVEAKAIFLAGKAHKHRQLQLDEASSPYARALSETKHLDYQKKYEKALRVCALLEERLRHSPASPLSQRSRSLTMPGAPEGASLLSAHNLFARLVEEAPLPDLIT